MTADKRKLSPSCADCDYPDPERLCMDPDGKPGKHCPTLGTDELQAEALKEYQDPATREFARQASIQEAECYINRHQRPYVMQPSKTRIVEICEFAHKMGYRRIGLAFCLGLSQEAGMAAKVFRDFGLEVVSAVCKAGRASKEKVLGLGDEGKIRQDTDETMCNPILQAKLLNQAGSEFNVLLGLCVGHDSMFLAHAQAPCTVLAVKDRVTGHNPLAALYTSHTYYKKLEHPELNKG